MLKKAVVLVILLFNVYVGYAQGDVTITPENAPRLTVMAELQLRETLTGQPGFTHNDVAWSPDGTQIAVSREDVAWIFDLANPNRPPMRYQQSVQEAPGCGGGQALVRDIAFSGVEPNIAAVSTNTQVSILNTAAQTTLATLELFANEITFLPQGQLAMLTNNDLQVWDYGAGAVREFGLDSYYGDGAMTAAPDGGAVALMDVMGYVTVQNPLNGQVIEQYEPPCSGPAAGGGCGFRSDIDVVTYASGGQILLTRGHLWCQEYNTFNAFSTITGAQIYEVTGEPIHVAGSPTADLAAVITAEGGLGEPSQITGVQLIQSFTGEAIATLPHDEVRAMAFSPSGDRIATISNSYARIWALPEALPTREEAMSYSEVIVDAVCDVAQPVGLGQTVSIGWSWYAQTPEQLQDHVINAHYTLDVNNVPVIRWMFVTQPVRAPEFDNDWTSYYYMPIGDEPPGVQLITNAAQWDNAISDGYGQYGPGTETETTSTNCTYRVG